MQHQAFGLTPLSFYDATGLFTKIIFGSSPTGHGSSIKNGEGYIDPRFRRLLWHLISSTRGGANRAKILDFINSNPTNANKIANELKLDYKTVIHHLRVLSENGLIVTDNRDSYAATYFLTPLMEKNYPSLKEILDRIGKK